MFLTTDKPVTSFDYVRDHGVSCTRSAIEAELAYITNTDRNLITVEMIGAIVILDGSCQTQTDALQAIRVAEEIAGRGNIISHITVTCDRAAFEKLG